MKVKHTKLKKSIFLILICISLTTTFVVSASASSSFPYTGYTVTFELYTGDPTDPIFYDELGSFPVFPLVTGVTLSQIYINSGSDPLVFQGVNLDPFTSYYVTIGDLSDPFSNIFIYPFSFNIHSLFVYQYLNEGGLIEISRSFDPDEVLPDLFVLGLGVFPYESDWTDTRYVIRCYGEPFSSSPSFTDSVGSGLTSSLSWVGQVVESLTTGPIKPLLECFAVTISVSALLLGIYSIRRYIWCS